MVYSYADYPPDVAKDIVRLRDRIRSSGIPRRGVDQNLLIGTWNVRSFGGLHESWQENADSPKRNLRGLACIAEIVKLFDVIAIQEIGAETKALRVLLEDFLGDHWGVVLSDISQPVEGGHTERLAYLYDERRVHTSGLAGEIVIPKPPAADGREQKDVDPVEQFDRTPYIVGFSAGSERFALLTVHIRYGDSPEDRIDEIRSLSKYIARELRRRSREATEERNLIVLGDFNIDSRLNDPLFDAFLESGLQVPVPIRTVRTTYGTEAKHYDQIAWFMGELDLLTEGRAGVIDFAGAVYPGMSLHSMSFRVSDHFPLWAEFMTDRSREQFASTLDVDPAAPEPFVDFIEDMA
jgi:endonuclease/exonuclease/phosphatase family metal-dependent hydrolase